MFKFHRGLAAVLALILAGCASGKPVLHKPAKIIAAKQGKTATVYLTRASTWLWSRLPAHVMLDGKEIGIIKNGQCVRLTVPSGKHHLQVVSNLMFGAIGASLGNSLAESFGTYNLVTKPGEAQFFFTHLVPNPPSSYIYETLRRPTGRKC